MSPGSDTKPPAGRLAIGATLFGVGMLCPLLVPLVAATALPPGWKAGLSGVLLLGVPEVFTIAAVGVLGKPGYAWLRGRLFAALRRMAPPDQVGPVRYRLGLVLFTLPLLEGWLGPYARPHLLGPDAPVLLLHVGGDVMFVASIIVLGGDFWDKLRALFVHRAVVRWG